jgi:hypothetical protein
MKKTDLEDYVASELENKSFEELLEAYDLSPYEVFWFLYRNGLIDEELLEATKEC